jgi:HEAT repeat protein
MRRWLKETVTSTDQSYSFMSDQDWIEIVRALEAPDVDTAVGAAENLDARASLDDIPRLLALLGHEDFFVREAAAWPLCHLAGPLVLKELFAAYQLGFDQGHDNDGFTAALLDMDLRKAKEPLNALLDHGDEMERSHAAWLLGFC